MTDLTIVIPTRGRSTLPRCLDSIRSQASPGAVEILLVVDTHSPLISDPLRLAHEYACMWAEHDAGYHDWGYPQLRYGYERAQGRYILNCGDDDVYVAGAIPAILAALRETGEGPVMFRAEMHPSPNRGNREPVVLWSEKRLVEQVITGQNLATPNVPGRIGGWACDWMHALETVSLWGGLVHWREELIVRCY